MGRYDSVDGTYEGFHKAGKWHGPGKFTWANEDVYRGTFIDNKMYGMGTKTASASGIPTRGWWEGDGTPQPLNHNCV